MQRGGKGNNVWASAPSNRGTFYERRMDIAGRYQVDERPWLITLDLMHVGYGRELKESSIYIVQVRRLTPIVCDDGSPSIIAQVT